MQEPIEVGRLSSYLRCSPTVVEIEPGTLGSEDRTPVARGSASPCYRGQSEPSSYLSSSPTVHVVMQNTITCRMQEPIEVGRLSSYLRCSPTVVEIEPGTLGSEDRTGSAARAIGVSLSQVRI